MKINLENKVVRVSSEIVIGKMRNLIAMTASSFRLNSCLSIGWRWEIKIKNELIMLGWLYVI